MAKIKDLSISVLEMIIILSERNPGAITAITEMITKSKEIDPDSALSADLAPLILDTYGIYGSRIWMLYSDVCKKNMHTMLGLLRSVQLGQLRLDKLNHAIDNYGEGLDIPELLKAVKERLPNFKIEE